MDRLIEGRMVHFVCENGKHRAAIVVNVVDKDKGACDLFVFALPGMGEGGFFMRIGAEYSDENKEGTWHWFENPENEG